MRVLVTGAAGQLGLDLVDAFADVDVTAVDRAELDVSDGDRVTEVVAAAAPDVVLNAAAWTDVDGCETDAPRAHAVNAVGPWHLARACAARGATLVTVSTDYVFDGAAPLTATGTRRPYAETDTPAPVSVYGASKLAGERLVRAALPAHHIVRTAWLSGARGRNFVRTMLRLADTGEPVRVVDDQIGTPTTTRDLAAGIRRLVATRRYGTVHLAGSGQASWFEVAAATFELAGRQVDLQPQPSSAIDRPAPRPAWSVLGGDRAAAIGAGPLPHWRDGLAALLAELGELADPGAARP